MTDELNTRVDVVVLDLSRRNRLPKPSRKKHAKMAARRI